LKGSAKKWRLISSFNIIFTLIHRIDGAIIIGIIFWKAEAAGIHITHCFLVFVT